jgi:hypothetical protein
LLSTHEEWLVGIFEGFLDILLEKFRANFPVVPSELPSDITPPLTKPLEHSLPLATPPKDAFPLSLPVLPHTDPKKAWFSLIPLDIVLLSYQAEPSYKEILTNAPVQTFNSHLGCPSTLDRSNFIVWKNPKKNPFIKRKKDLGAVERGLSTSPILTSPNPSNVSSHSGPLRETIPPKRVI